MGSLLWVQGLPWGRGLGSNLVFRVCGLRFVQCLRSCFCGIFCQRAVQLSARQQGGAHSPLSFLCFGFLPLFFCFRIIPSPVCTRRVLPELASDSELESLPPLDSSEESTIFMILLRFFFFLHTERERVIIFPNGLFFIIKTK